MNTLLVALLTFVLTVEAGPRPPTAVEMAAATASCMTWELSYPEGQGVAVLGNIYGARLLDADGSPFGDVLPSIEAGGADLVLTAIPPEAPEARARAMYRRGTFARDCFAREYERLDPGHTWRPQQRW